MNSHMKQTYGSKIADLLDLIRFDPAPYSQLPLEAEKSLFHFDWKSQGGWHMAD